MPGRKVFLVPSLILWLFVGWPVVWKYPEIPPRVSEVLADSKLYTSSGTWTAPTGVTSVDVECWGGGGGGGRGTTKNAGGGGGGGGGGYAKKLSIPVTSGNNYTVTVGTGGASATNGSSSSFTGNSSINVTATGGSKGSDNGSSGGSGGSGNCTGGCNVSYTGGSGGAGGSSYGGGGGGSAGTGSNGNAGDQGNSGGSGALAVTGGGPGGNGGVSGQAGSIPSGGYGGGGGGGGNRSGGTTSGGAGYTGKCLLSWTVITISVSVSDGSVAYGILPVSTSKSTLSGDLNDMQTATNDGNVSVNLNIKGQDASGGGCSWTLSSTSGSNQYVHSFCNDTDLDCASPPTNYTALTTNYQSLDTGVAVSGTVNFQLRLTTPSSSSCYGQQTADVTVQAVAQ